MDAKRIEELREMCEKATAGPWKCQAWDFTVCVTYKVEDLDGSQHWVPQNDYYIGGSPDDDAAFIAAARTALPELLDEVERLQAKVIEVNHNRWDHADELRAEIQSLKDELKIARCKHHVFRIPDYVLPAPIRVCMKCGYKTMYMDDGMDDAIIGSLP